MTRIYLDHCATTPLHPAARQAMEAVLAEGMTGHASSVHKPGREAEALVSRAREQVADALEARPSEVVFTGSGTESNNLALKGAAEALRANGRGNHIITTRIEHESVLEPCRFLERQGFRITYLPVDLTGNVDGALLEQAITPETILISAMLVNHETGALLPIAELAKRARRAGISLHTDASMAMGRVPVSAKALDVDLLTVSAHKFGGPQGVGALYIRRGLKLQPQQHGGQQERKRRAGVENVLGIVGAGAAAEHTGQNGGAHLSGLTVRLQEGILRSISNVHLNTPSNACPGILNVSFADVEGQSLLMNLDLAGIFVSSGAPCSSGSLDPSPVLLALDLGMARARQSIRFSLGPTTTDAEIDVALDRLIDAVHRLRSLGAGRGRD